MLGWSVCSSNYFRFFNLGNFFIMILFFIIIYLFIYLLIYCVFFFLESDLTFIPCI